MSVLAILVADDDPHSRAAELAAELRPHVVIVDLTAAGSAGVAIVRELRQRNLPVRFLVLSDAVDEPRVTEALAAGADGCARKDSSAGELLHAIREVAAGRRYVSPAPSEERRAHHRPSAASAASGPDLYASLTGREREVLHLAAEGLRNREIAERLGISPRTAESHRAHLMAKLKLRREAELVRYALRRGLVPLEPVP